MDQACADTVVERRYLHTLKDPLGSGGRLAELDELEGVLAVVVLSRSGVEDHDRFILGQPPRVSE